MPYIGRSSDFGVRQRYYFTQASAGATSISGLDDDGRRLKIPDGNYADVYLNGVLLVADLDYNTNTANTISSLTALAVNDVVEIVTYDAFNVADTVAASTGGEFDGGLKARRYQNPNTLTENFTIATNDNAMLVGPVTMSGTVTINGTLTVV